MLSSMELAMFSTKSDCHLLLLLISIYMLLIGGLGRSHHSSVSPVPSSSAFSTSILPPVLSPIFSSGPVSVFSSFGPGLSAILSLLFALFPRGLGKILVVFERKGSVISGVFKLFGGWFLGEGNFKNGEEAFLVDSDKTLFTRFPDINNFLF